MEDHTLAQLTQKLSVDDFVRQAKEIELLKLQLAQKDRQQEKENALFKLQLAQKDRQQEKENALFKLQLAQKDRQQEKENAMFKLQLAQKDQEIAGLKQTVLLSALGNKTDAAVSEWLDKVETVISSKELEKFLPPVSDGVFPSRKTIPPTKNDKEDIHQNFLRDMFSSIRAKNQRALKVVDTHCSSPLKNPRELPDFVAFVPKVAQSWSTVVLVMEVKRDIQQSNVKPQLIRRWLTLTAKQPHRDVFWFVALDSNSVQFLRIHRRTNLTGTAVVSPSRLHCKEALPFHVQCSRSYPLWQGEDGKKCGQGLHYLLRLLYTSPEDLGFELEKDGEQVRLWLEPVVKESILVECIFRGILQEQASVFSITRRNRTPTVLKRCQRNRSRHQGSLTRERQVMMLLGLQSTSPDADKVKRLRMPLLLNHYVRDKYEALEMWPLGEETLEQWCRREVRRFKDLLKLFKQVEEALRAAHLKEILHSDVKPSNIILWASSTNPSASLQAVLIDWGLATKVGRKYSTKELSGTLAFMSRAMHRAKSCADVESYTASVLDDYESLFYSLLACLNGGSLPWSQICREVMAEEDKHYALYKQKVQLLFDDGKWSEFVGKICNWQRLKPEEGNLLGSQLNSLRKKLFAPPASPFPWL